MPDQALQAFMDHGAVSRTIDSNVSEAEGIYSALEKLGIDWTAVGTQLEDEGVDSFKKAPRGCESVQQRRDLELRSLGVA